MQLYACIILHVIGNRPHNWTVCTIQQYAHNLSLLQTEFCCMTKLIIVNVHNPLQFNTALLSLSENWQDYHAIPGMSDVAADEFVKYVDVIGSEPVKSLTDIITF